MKKSEKKTETLLVKVISTDEDCTTSRFAIISLTPKLKETVLSLKKERDGIEKRLGKFSIYQLTQFNGSCDYVDEQECFDEEKNSEKIINELEEVLGGQSYTKIKPTRKKIIFVRSDVDVLHVSQFGFKFSCYIKHTNTKLDTDTIEFDVFPTF